MSKQKPWSEIVRKAADERIARMTDCEESLVNRIREREQQLADRDAAWERAIEAWWNKGRRASDSKDFLAAIREILEAEGGWA